MDESDRLRKQEAAEERTERKQEAAEAEKRSDAKMAAMEIARKEGEDRNFLVAEISTVAAIASAYASVAFSEKDPKQPLKNGTTDP